MSQNSRVTRSGHKQHGEDDRKRSSTELVIVLTESDCIKLKLVTENKDIRCILARKRKRLTPYEQPWSNRFRNHWFGERRKHFQEVMEYLNSINAIFLDPTSPTDVCVHLCLQSPVIVKDGMSFILQCVMLHLFMMRREILGVTEWRFCCIAQ